MRTLITLRKYFLWPSNWFCDYHYYRILFNDLKINHYLTSIFYRLRLPTSQFIISRNYNKMFIEFTFLLKSFLLNMHHYKKMVFFMKRNRYLLLSSCCFSVNSYYLYKKVSFLILCYLFSLSLSKVNVFKTLSLKNFLSVSDKVFNKQLYVKKPSFNKYNWFIRYISQIHLSRYVLFNKLYKVHTFPFLKMRNIKTSTITPIEQSTFSLRNTLSLTSKECHFFFSKNRVYNTYFHNKLFYIYNILRFQKKNMSSTVRYFDMVSNWNKLKNHSIPFSSIKTVFTGKSTGLIHLNLLKKIKSFFSYFKLLHPSLYKSLFSFNDILFFKWLLKILNSKKTNSLAIQKNMLFLFLKVKRSLKSTFSFLKSNTKASRTFSIHEMNYDLHNNKYDFIKNTIYSFNARLLRKYIFTYKQNSFLGNSFFNLFRWENNRVITKSDVFYRSFNNSRMYLLESLPLLKKSISLKKENHFFSNFSTKSLFSTYLKSDSYRRQLVVNSFKCCLYNTTVFTSFNTFLSFFLDLSDSKLLFMWSILYKQYSHKSKKLFIRLCKNRKINISYYSNIVLHGLNYMANWRTLKVFDRTLSFSKTIAKTRFLKRKLSLYTLSQISTFLFYVRSEYYYFKFFYYANLYNNQCKGFYKKSIYYLNLFLNKSVLMKVYKNKIFYTFYNTKYSFLYNCFIHVENKWLFFINKFNLLFLKYRYLKSFSNLDNRLVFLSLCYKKYELPMSLLFKNVIGTFFFHKLPDRYNWPSKMFRAVRYKLLLKLYYNLSKGKDISRNKTFRFLFWKLLKNKSYLSDVFFSQFKIFYNYYLILNRVYNTFKFYFSLDFRYPLYKRSSYCSIKNVSFFISKKKISYTYKKRPLLLKYNTKIKLMSSYSLFIFVLHNIIFFFKSKLFDINSSLKPLYNFNESSDNFSHGLFDSSIKGFGNGSPLLNEKVKISKRLLFSNKKRFYTRLKSNSFLSTYHSNLFCYRLNSHTFFTEYYNASFYLYVCFIINKLAILFIVRSFYCRTTFLTPYYIVFYSTFKDKNWYTLKYLYKTFLYLFWKEYKSRRDNHTLFKGWCPNLVLKHLLRKPLRVYFHPRARRNFKYLCYKSRSYQYTFNKASYLLSNSYYVFTSPGHLDDFLSIHRNRVRLLNIYRFFLSEKKQLYLKKKLFNVKHYIFCKMYYYFCFRYLLECRCKGNKLLSSKDLYKYGVDFCDRLEFTKEDTSCLSLSVYMKGTLMHKHRAAHTYFLKYLEKNKINWYSKIRNVYKFNKMFIRKRNEKKEKSLLPKKRLERELPLLYKDFTWYGDYRITLANVFSNKYNEYPTFLYKGLQKHLSSFSYVYGNFIHLPIESHFIEHWPIRRTFVFLDRFLNSFSYRWVFPPFSKRFLVQSANTKLEFKLFSYYNIKGRLKKRLYEKFDISKTSFKHRQKRISFLKSIKKPSDFLSYYSNRLSSSSVLYTFKTYFNLHWVLNVFSSKHNSNSFYTIHYIHSKNYFFYSTLFKCVYYNTFKKHFFNFTFFSYLNTFFNLLFLYLHFIIGKITFYLKYDVSFLFKNKNVFFLYSVFTLLKRHYFYRSRLFFTKNTFFNKLGSYFFIYSKYSFLGNYNIKSVFRKNSFFVLNINILNLYPNLNVFKYIYHYRFNNFFNKYFSILYLYNKNSIFNFLNNVTSFLFSKKLYNKVYFLRNQLLSKRLKRMETSSLTVTNKNIFLKNDMVRGFMFTDLLHRFHFNILSYPFSFISIIKVLQHNIFSLNNFLFYFWYTRSLFSGLWNKYSFLIKFYFILFLKKIYLVSNIIILKKRHTIQLIKYLNSFFNIHSLLVRSSFYSNLLFNFFIVRFKTSYFSNYLDDSTLFSFLKTKSYTLLCRHIYLLKYWFFFQNLEHTISHYTNMNCFLIVSFNFRLKYVINSAKMWCDKMLFAIKKKMHIKKVFALIRSQQRRELFYKSLPSFNDNLFTPYKYPLQGIRILYSGNLKKAKRKQKIRYHLWVSDVKYYGPLSTNTFKRYIDYHHHSIALKRSTIGIKLWLLFYME